jgi:hypothetical protein
MPRAERLLEAAPFLNSPEATKALNSPQPGQPSRSGPGLQAPAKGTCWGERQHDCAGHRTQSGTEDLQLVNSKEKVLTSWGLHA